MKQLFSKLVACSTVVLAISLATTAHAEVKQSTAKVRKIIGTAQVSMDGGGWTALKVNDVVKQGASIRTGVDSTVDVFLNNSVVRITPETTMSVDKLMTESSGAENIYQTQLNLKNGHVLGNVRKLAHASKYEIKTPTGVAGIRGTDFDITVAPRPGGGFILTITSVQGTIVGSAVNNSGNLVTAVINTGETWNPDEATVRMVPPEVLAVAQGMLRDMGNSAGGSGDHPTTTPSPDTVQRIEPVTSRVTVEDQP